MHHTTTFDPEMIAIAENIVLFKSLPSNLDSAVSRKKFNQFISGLSEHQIEELANHFGTDGAEVAHGFMGVTDDSVDHYRNHLMQLKADALQPPPVEY